MGIRFTLFVPRKRDGVLNQLLGGNVSLRPCFQLVAGLPQTVQLDADGYGEVVNLERFAELVEAHLRERFDGRHLPTAQDGDYGYWQELRELARVGLAFREYGAEAKLLLC